VIVKPDQNAMRLSILNGSRAFFGPRRSLFRESFFKKGGGHHVSLPVSHRASRFSDFLFQDPFRSDPVK
jgi:hypothetical protein